MRLCFVVACFCCLASPARANDSEAEVAIGGLTLKKSDAIAIESEDLYISRDIVRVKYRFVNTSDAPVDTLVAFPLPDIPAMQEEENIGYWSDAKELKFSTKVDGKPFPLDILEQAIFKGEDVSARLAALRIPVNHMSNTFAEAVGKAPKAERDRLIADGLLRDAGAGNDHVFVPQWSVRTIVTRRQTFPPNARVTVEHEYVPRAGGSVGGGLSKEYRNESYFTQTRRKYCIDDDFLASLDRKGKKGAAYSEIWLGYVLTTGANWKGPITDFRLVVDKGKPESLVSFCAEGVKKISPTRFESRRKSFTPEGDLDVLIVDWRAR